MYADSEYWLPHDPHNLEAIVKKAEKEHIIGILQREHQRASQQPYYKPSGLDESHPLPDPNNPSAKELLSCGFVVLMEFPPGRPPACPLNPNLNDQHWLDSLSRMCVNAKEELNAVTSSEENLGPLSDNSSWWEALIDRVLKPKVKLLTALDLDIPDWRLPDPQPEVQDYGETSEKGDPEGLLEDSRECVQGTTFLVIDQAELKRRKRKVAQAEDLLKERDLLERGEFVIYAYTVDGVPDKTYLALGEVQGWEGDNTKGDCQVFVRWYKTTRNIFGYNSRYFAAFCHDSNEPYIDHIERATIVKTRLKLFSQGFFSEENGSKEAVKNFLNDTQNLYTLSAPPEVRS